MKSKNNLILVSGPSKGGKSKWAESLFNGTNDVTYIATLINDLYDLDLLNKINRHKMRRPSNWLTIESNGDLIPAIKSVEEGKPILIDSIGGFVTKYINEENLLWESISQEFLDIVTIRRSTIVLVLEEVGWGVVPQTKIGCIFRDRLGELNQLLEKKAIESWLVIHGRALNLKLLGESL